MKRQRETFKSREIAHVWANKGAPHGRVSGGRNMSFDGDTFSSHSTVIARRITHKGKEAYVVDDYSFSSSTSKHHGEVISAIGRDSGRKIFGVTGGSRGQRLNFTPATLRDHYLSEFKELCKPSTSRLARIRARQILAADLELSKAIGVCDYFNLPSKRLRDIDLKRTKITDEAADLVKAWGKKHDAAMKVIWERESKGRSEQYARTIANAIERATRLLAGEDLGSGADHFGHLDHMLDSRPDLKAKMPEWRIERDKLDIAAWLSGSKDVHPKYDWPTMLRVEDQEIVTTKGARFPLEHGERSFKFVMRYRSTGWKRNGHTHHVGMYQIDEINAEGVKAGCHLISWTELDRFSRLMGWVKDAVAA